jgi:hypothetical protein
MRASLKILGPAVSLVMSTSPGGNLIAQTDTSAPSFTILRTVPSVIDVTNGPATAEVELRIIDDVTGLSSGSVLVLLEDVALKWFFNNNSLIDGQPTDGVYRVPITFQPGSPPGDRPIGAIVFDNANRSNSGYSDSVVITVINNGIIDQEPPTIHSLNLTPRILDLTDGPGNVTLEMEVSDDASGITYIRGDLEPPIDDFSPDTRIFQWSRPTTGSERKVLTATYPLGQWSPAGEWRLILESFFDGVERGSEYGFRSQKLYEDFDATITVINPNQDIVKPAIESVSFDQTTADTSFGKAFLPYTVNFTDATSGLDYVTIHLHPPSGGKYIWSLTRAENNLESGTINNGSLTGRFEVPPFIEEGNWWVSVHAKDRAGNRNAFGFKEDNPLPPGTPSTIRIENSAGVDQELMQVTMVVFEPDSVDITEISQFVDLTVAYTDNLSGIASISARVESPDGAFREFLNLDTDDIVSGTTKTGAARIQFRIPKFSEPGFWTIESFSTRDAAGNYDSLIGSPVFFDDRANGFTVINNGAVDLEPPVLVSMTLPQTVVDVTNDNQRIPIRAIASDDVSGVDSTVFYYRHPETRDRIGFFPGASDIVSRNGNTVIMEDTGLIRQFAEPGDYFLDEVTLYDVVDRRTQFRADREPPFPEGLPDKVTVINNGPVDREDPQFTDIRLSTTTVDITNGPQFISMEIDFTDDESGLEDIDVQIYHEEEAVFPTLFDSWLEDDPFEIVSGTSQIGTARFLVKVPQYLPPGMYEVKYELTDVFRRRESLRGDAEDPGSFPFTGSGVITVINSGAADRLDPTVTEISIAETPDVTDLSREITVSMSILDDVSGVKEVALTLYGPESDSVREERFEQDLTIGSPTDGTFNFPITIPAFAEAGEWTIRAWVKDNVNNFQLLYPDELQALGLQHTFTVVNRQPAGYLWKDSKAYPGDWREVDWFGWVQDRQTYPYVYHLEHGWIYTDGSDLERFFFYDVTLGVWWWVDKGLYPYMYASGRFSGWYFYYAPYGSPGNRWFHDLGRVLDVPESEL